MKPKLLFNSDIINILIITAIWIVMVILVNPLGNFGLNDDWAYGFSVKSLIEKGQLEISTWTAPNLLAQIFWGALFCLPVGFSFTALRFSTLTLGLVGAIANYGLLREVNLHQKFALYGALIVAFNPIYFGLANTFMTDVPFFAVGSLSVYFLIRGLKRDSNIEIIIGILFACIALLIRQLGFAIFLGFGCTYVIKNQARLKSFIKGFSPTILGVLIQLSYQGWLRSTRQNIPDLHGKQIQDIINIFSGFNWFFLIEFFLKNTMLALVYLGLFMLLFTIVIFPLKFQSFSQKERGITIFALLIIFIIVGAAVISKGFQIPITRNILSEFGMGPLTLRDGYILNNLPVPQALKIFWLIVTSISIVGAVLLILYLIFAFREILWNDSRYQGEEKWLKVLIISEICIYFAPLGIGGFFDRYLIFLLPFLMMMVVVFTRNITLDEKLDNRLISLVMIIMLFSAWFTIGATHDYLSWNRVRWQALDNLMQESKISPNHIDGGYEFNGWYLYSPKYKGKREKSWWWVDRDDYMISFSLLDGYKEVKRYPFKKWLPFGPTNILVSRKSTVSSSHIKSGCIGIISRGTASVSFFASAKFLGCRAPTAVIPMQPETISI
jgi:Dolichyl-phosphate-mannose-protein mannosyltransferase